MLALLLLQRAAPADTIVALTMPAERTVFDVAAGSLQLVVLVLGVAALAALVALLLGVRQTLTRLEAQLTTLRTDATPLITRLNDVAADARVVSTQLRRDVDRVSAAANRMGDSLDHAAARTSMHFRQADQTWTAAQGEIDETIRTATSVLRGVRLGAVDWLAGSSADSPNGGHRDHERSARVSRHRRRSPRKRPEAPRLRPRDDDE
jgi:uncharacterized protein YoxC